MRRMGMTGFYFWLRILIAVLDALWLSILIYDTVFHPGSVTKRELLWQAFGVISLTLALVFATHPSR